MTWQRPGRCLLAVMLIAWVGLTACAPPSTRVAASGDGGIGGTGISGDGGIGGTGIVGVITDFGSIIVNGRRVVIPSGLAITSHPGAPAVGAVERPQDLRIGHTVIVRAVRQSERWVARDIRLSIPLSGPIDMISPDGLIVLGRHVRVDGATVVAMGSGAPRLGDTSALSPGDWVRVSGLPTGDTTVTASRIDRLSTREAAQPAFTPLSLSVDVFGGAVDRLVLQTTANPRGQTLVLTANPGRAEQGLAGSQILEGRLEDGVLQIDRRRPFPGIRRNEDNEDQAWDRPPADWDGDDTDEAVGDVDDEGWADDEDAEVEGDDAFDPDEQDRGSDDDEEEATEGGAEPSDDLADPSNADDADGHETDTENDDDADDERP